MNTYDAQDCSRKTKVNIYTWGDTYQCGTVHSPKFQSDMLLLPLILTKDGVLHGKKKIN